MALIRLASEPIFLTNDDRLRLQQTAALLSIPRDDTQVGSCNAAWYDDGTENADPAHWELPARIGLEHMSTYYLTTPIYYPNAKPHIGTAFCTIGSDVQARYRRLKGYDTFFLRASMRTALTSSARPEARAGIRRTIATKWPSTLGISGSG